MERLFKLSKKFSFRLIAWIVFLLFFTQYVDTILAFIGLLAAVYILVHLFKLFIVNNKDLKVDDSKSEFEINRLKNLKFRYLMACVGLELLLLSLSFYTILQKEYFMLGALLGILLILIYFF